MDWILCVIYYPIRENTSTAVSYTHLDVYKRQVRYEEIFITSFDGDVLGLYDHLGEYESIDELNHLAHVLSDLDQSDIEKFEAVIDSGEYTGNVHDLINLAQNLDCYDFYPGIDSEEALGRVYICLLYTSRCV